MSSSTRKGIEPTPGTLPGYRVMMSFANDTGSSATDHITKNPIPGIVGIVNPAPAAGENLYGSVDGGTTWQLITTTGSLVKWNPTLPANSPGTTAYLLRVVDLAGNIGPTFTQTFVVDTIAPATPVISLGTGIADTSNGATLSEATQTGGIVRVAADAQTMVTVEFTDSATPVANRVSRVITGSGMANAIPITLDATDIGIGTGQLRDGIIGVRVTSTDVAGNATLGTSSFKLDTLAPQMFGQSLRLNAANSQYATMPYLASSSGTISGDMTLEAWIYVNADYVSGGPDMPILTLNSGAAGNTIALKVNSLGGLVFEAFNGNGATSIMSRQTANGAISAYKWTHIAATVNNNSTGIIANVYINGAIPSGTSGSATNNTPIPTATRSNAYIGYNGTHYFNGSISDVRVYDNERTAAQIAADLNGIVDTADANLKAWYPLLSNSSSGLAAPANISAGLTGSPAFTNIPFLSVNNDTAPNGQTNNDLIFNIATQTQLTGTLLYPYEAGETISISGVSSYGLVAYPILGSRTFNINNVVFTPGSNNLRIQISDASGNIGPECTVPYTLDTVAPTNAVPVGLQLNAASTQYATLPAFAAGTISGDLTLEAWINYEPVTSPTVRTIIKLGSGGKTDLIVLNLDFTSGASNGKLQFKYDDGSLADKTFTSGTVLTPNTWNHVAVTVNNSRVLTLYVNGIASGTTFTLPTAIASVNRNVNTLGVWSAFSNTEFNGSIRDVRIYDNTRTLTDIQSDLTGAVDVSDQNLKAYYSLNLSAQSGLQSGTALALVGSPTYVLKQSVSFSNDTSPDNTGNTDLVTKTSTQTISGKLALPLASDEYVWVRTDSGSNWKKAAATVGTNTWSLPGTVTLVAGNVGNNIQVKVSDLAGNDGPIVTQTYTLDTTAPVRGFINQVLALDSSKKQYASLPSGAINLNGDSTLEAWVFANGSANGSYIFDFATATQSEYRLSLYIGATGTTSAGKLVFECFSTLPNPASVVSTGSLPINTWSHISTVVTTSSFTIYIDGINSGTLSWSNGVPTSNRTANFVGKSKSNNGYFNGYISDVRILDYALTADEVRADMSNSVSVGGASSGTYLFNGTATSYNATLTSDLVSPVVPGYKQALTFSADTGESATDEVTRIAEQTITFMLKGALASDETIVGSLDNGVTWVDIIKNGGSISNSVVSWPTTLAVGTTNLKLKVSDSAGNYGPESTVPYTLDTTAPTLDLNSSTAGNNTSTTISTANAGSFSSASAILPSVTTVTATDVAKITLDFVESGNVLKTNDRLKVGTLVANLDLSATSSSLTGAGTLGSLTGLDYTYDNSTHLLSLFKHDGSAMNAASIASALRDLQFMNSSGTGSPNIPGTRDFALQLIDMAGNTASANGNIIIS